MGLSTKQVPGDKVVQFEAAELSKPPPMRRQQQQSEVSKCPRCESTNTKFCYYNNYNKSQPRHFCKSCKRHWTKGGTLRNVPLGGGRKNKRPKISNTATKTVATTTTTHDDHKTAPSSVFYEPLIMGSSNNGMINTTHSTSFNTELQYFSSVSSNIDSCNASLFPISYNSLNVYDQYSCNLDSMEESTITTANIPTTSNVAWPGLDNSGTMDLSNYWDWSEIDVITSSDHFNNMSWDDYEEDDGGAKIKL